MVDMVASGMAASENAARVYGNGEERFSSKAPAGKNSVGKSDGNTAEKAGTSFHKYIENAIQKETRAFTEGKDVVMACPPLYRTNYQVDMNKPREEMSLDEYKQYICNTISSLSVSDSKRMCGNGVLIFKEEALENMKNDSAYEQEVIRMLGENFSKQLSDYEPYVEYQVIGKTKEECYGASIPLKSYGWMMGVQSGLASRLLLGSGSTLSGYGLGSSGLLTSNLSGYGLGSSGLLTSNLSGTGLISSGLLGGNLSGLGLLASGLSGYGLLSSGLSSQGMQTLGVNRASMVNAYKNTLKNKNNGGSIRLSERR
jgi:hypothetical protein